MNLPTQKTIEKLHDKREFLNLESKSGKGSAKITGSKIAMSRLEKEFGADKAKKMAEDIVFNFQYRIRGKADAVDRMVAAMEKKDIPGIEMSKKIKDYTVTLAQVVEALSGQEVEDNVANLLEEEQNAIQSQRDEAKKEKSNLDPERYNFNNVFGGNYGGNYKEGEKRSRGIATKAKKAPSGKAKGTRITDVNERIKAAVKELKFINITGVKQRENGAWSGARKDTQTNNTYLIKEGLGFTVPNAKKFDSQADDMAEFLAAEKVYKNKKEARAAIDEAYEAGHAEVPEEVKKAKKAKTSARKTGVAKGKEEEKPVRRARKVQEEEEEEEEEETKRPSKRR